MESCSIYTLFLQCSPGWCSLLPQIEYWLVPNLIHKQQVNLTCCYVPWGCSLVVTICNLKYPWEVLANNSWYYEEAISVYSSITRPCCLCHHDQPAGGYLVPARYSHFDEADNMTPGRAHHLCKHFPFDV